MSTVSLIFTKNALTCSEQAQLVQVTVPGGVTLTPSLPDGTHSGITILNSLTSVTLLGVYMCVPA